MSCCLRTDRGGKAADTGNFAELLAEMRSSWGTSYGISVTLPSSYWYLQGFDLVTMSTYVDWFNFMSYDIHGVWDATNQYTGPYIRPHTNLTEIKAGLDLLWMAGIKPSKVTIGLRWIHLVPILMEFVNSPGVAILALVQTQLEHFPLRKSKLFKHQEL
ncbi:class V chitinase [Penicillium canescens]|nr:class V chitinase [Penicillium canescens]